MKRHKARNGEPILAPGMDDGQELERSATSEEIEHGEYTKVVKLSYDEVDASK
ncbi:hypothetical protein [Ectobacillus panaciterrae]|uniref:hypothetical protein n=1 Tax=Ectobacillus panaciterrae TaxID=363872 RepID=UPI0004175816|nr:hypothetical protein [Ectobacillus panaciterrae]